jgi:transposase
MPPAYVKPYVKRQKSDATDADAICEAVTRANMRFVPTKTSEQQSGPGAPPRRQMFIRQQTSVINAIRAHLAEFGIVAPVGRNGVEELLNVVADRSDQRMPEVARACLVALKAQLQMLKGQILSSTPDPGLAPVNEASKRLDEHPGGWPSTGDSPYRQCCKSEGVPIRSGLLGMDRPCTKTALQRRQGQARQYQQAR